MTGLAQTLATILPALPADDEQAIALVRAALARLLGPADLSDERPA